MATNVIGLHYFDDSGDEIGVGRNGAATTSSSSGTACDPSAFLRCVAQNILTCPCHEGAARETEELSLQDQYQVWKDITGKDAGTVSIADAIEEEQDHAAYASASGASASASNIDPDNTMYREIREPPAFVNECLDKLNAKLLELVQEQQGKEGKNNDSNLNTFALELALRKYPNYVKDRKFQLKFLRAEHFDINATATRMVIHFETKYDIFVKGSNNSNNSKTTGIIEDHPDHEHDVDEILGREVELSDLDDDDDIHCLKMGYFQVLPITDQCNRKILFYYKALTNCYRKRENICRVVWYYINLISQEESVQQLGVINIVYNVGGFPKNGMDYEKSRRLSKVFRGVPVRFNSFLVCIDDSPWLNVVEVFSLMVNKFLRIRMRTIRGKFCRSAQCHRTAMLANAADSNNNNMTFCTHPIFLETKHMDMHNSAGTHTECLYQLMALGIPYYALPVNEHSELVLTDHYRWFNHQLEKEIQKKQQEMEEEDQEREERRKKRRHKRQRDHRHVKPHKNPDQMEQDNEGEQDQELEDQDDSSTTDDTSIEEADHEDDDEEYVGSAASSKIQAQPHAQSYSSFYFNHDAMSDLVNATSLHYLGGGRGSTANAASASGATNNSSGSGGENTTSTGQPTRLIG